MDRSEIRIPRPCGVDWETMTPADKGRFCGECKKVVRNISQLSEGEARQLIREENNGDLCVRYLHDKHGKVFFAGDRKQLIPAGLLSRSKRAALAAAAIALPLALNACNLPKSMGISSSAFSEEEAEEEELYPNQGGMEAPRDWPNPNAPDANADAHEADASKADATPTEAGPDGEADGGVIPIN